MTCYKKSDKLITIQEVKMDQIKQISKEALDYWGYEPQSIMLIEEMGELIMRSINI